MEEKKINKGYKKLCKFLSSNEFREPIREYLDDTCEKYSTEESITKNLEDIHQKFKQLIEEPLHKFLEENEIDDQLYNLFIKKSVNDNNINNKNHFKQLESYKRDTYLKELLNMRSKQINEEKRKKEEEERKKKELEEEERRKKEEEERKKKELEEEKRKRELEEKIEKNKKIKSNIIGEKIVIIGNLDITFNLTINEKIIKEKDSKLKFSDISSIKDCEFLLYHDELWDQIEMISGNKILTMLLNANNFSTKKIPIDYITLNKLDFNDEEELYEGLVYRVTQNNNLLLHDSQVCECNIDIKMHLICDKEEKNISIINSKKNKKKNEENIENNNENEKENKENKKENKENEDKNKEKEKENKFKKIIDPSLDSFEYIFIDFNDFNKKEISSINLEELTDFFKDIKKKEKSKIIFNIGKGDGSNIEQVIELLKYPDIYIFSNINNTYQLFNNIYDKKQEIEENMKTEEIKDIKNKKNKKIKKNDKENKKQEEINNNQIEENNEKKKEKENEDINDKKKKKKNNNKKKNDFDKRKIYEYFSETICKSCDLHFKEKIGIFIENFNKLIIIKVLNRNEPYEIINYDIKCYPKINPHNIKIIDEYKKIIKSNYDEYSNILLGCIIQKICEGGLNEENIYIGYLSGIEIIKKKIELKRNNLKEPSDPKFFKVNPSKNIINKTINQFEISKKEGQFKLDCDNKIKSKYKEYNPLLDNNLNPYFSIDSNEQILKNGGFITDKGFIVYDTIYKESLRPFLKSQKSEKIKGEQLLNIINEFKISKDLNNKEKSAEEEILKRNIVLERKLTCLQMKNQQFDLYKLKKKSSKKKNGNKSEEYNENKKVKEVKGKIKKKNI